MIAKENITPTKDITTTDTILDLIRYDNKYLNYMNFL